MLSSCPRHRQRQFCPFLESAHRAVNSLYQHRRTEGSLCCPQKKAHNCSIGNRGQVNLGRPRQSMTCACELQKSGQTSHDELCISDSLHSFIGQSVFSLLRSIWPKLRALCLQFATICHKTITELSSCRFLTCNKYVAAPENDSPRDPTRQKLRYTNHIQIPFKNYGAQKEFQDNFCDAFFMLRSQ